MSSKEEILVLVGSPRAEKSTSKSLGVYLSKKIVASEDQIRFGYINRLLLRSERYEKLFSMINEASIIILTFPLYVDHLPSPVIKAFEIISEKKRDIMERKEKQFIAISNCGFPEGEQINIAIKICRIFAKEIGFEWMGGLKVGAGPFIHGNDIKNAGKRLEHIKKGLSFAAEKITKGEKIPKETNDILADIPISKEMYKRIGNFGWRIQALKFRNIFNLKRKPYSKEK
ncbi:MAG: hypothetical protein BAJALOKI2v1_630001 [Promethearchaeota archaeon]|nr:MAG: hypothetical protein BAJALOKI2v1_630001 [Candidatus Lokiarchaeota archaeon]